MDFEVKNLRRMMQFAAQFPNSNIVVTLSRQLSWSYIIVIIPLSIILMNVKVQTVFALLDLLYNKTQTHEKG